MRLRDDPYNDGVEIPVNAVLLTEKLSVETLAVCLRQKRPHNPLQAAIARMARELGFTDCDSAKDPDMRVLVRDLSFMMINSYHIDTIKNLTE